MDIDLLIHPGEILKEEFLIPHGLSANGFATRLNVPPNAITAIVNGTRGISGSMSKLLGRAFGVSDEFFANLQTRFNIDLASVEARTDPRAAERLDRAGALARELVGRSASDERSGVRKPVNP